MLAGDLRQNHVGVSTSIVGDVGTRLVGVVQGYKPQVDWGGDSGSATIVVGGHNVRVATSGWRRRCLYTLLLALLAISVINLSLTLWILKTVHFNMEGMGHLAVVTRGLIMDGASEFSQKMYVAGMLSRKEQQLPLLSYYNLTIHTSDVNTTLGEDANSLNYVNKSLEDDANGLNNTTEWFKDDVPSYIHINVDDILASSKQFAVRDESGKELFQTSLEGSTVGADKFTVTGSQGAEIVGSMQTPYIFSKGTHELRLDSVTRDVKIRSKDEVRVKARNGDISSISTSNVSLIAKGGALKFDNPSIYMPKLKIEGKLIYNDELNETSTTTQYPTETQIRPPTEAPTTTPMPTQGGNQTTAPPQEVKVYQVCVCPSGKLFAVEAESICVPDDKVCR